MMCRIFSFDHSTVHRIINFIPAKFRTVRIFLSFQETQFIIKIVEFYFLYFFGDERFGFDGMINSDVFGIANFHKVLIDS
jgi:hypothetical protein